MDRVYIITGADGHLGRNLIALLKEQGAAIRALVLPDSPLPDELKEGVDVLYGDVRDPATLAPLFSGLEDAEKVVIHAAAIVDIRSETTPALKDVNVQGTMNMAETALEHGVYRFIHVSSVHAIPELNHNRCMTEVSEFSADSVHGGYAKTKAMASDQIINYVQEQGLPAVILHPSGIIGPRDSGSNHLVAGIKAFVQGNIPACPKGGYDFVDVRDVAQGIVSAVDNGRIGEAYILSGRYYEMRDVFHMVSNLLKRKFRCPSIPIWIAKLFAPLIEKWNLLRGKKPLITEYSVTALCSNANFSHEKASRELGYWPRDFYDTLKDTLKDLLPKKMQGKLATA